MCELFYLDVLFKFCGCLIINKFCYILQKIFLFKLCHFFQKPLAFNFKILIIRVQLCMSSELTTVCLVKCYVCAVHSTLCIAID